jgi:hypothetical protein
MHLKNLSEFLPINKLWRLSMNNTLKRSSFTLPMALIVSALLSACAGTRTIDPAVTQAHQKTSNFKAIAGKYMKDGKPSYDKSNLLDALEAAKAFNDAGMWKESREAFEIAHEGLAWKSDSVQTPSQVLNLVGTTLTSSAFGTYQGKIYEGGLIDYYQAINSIMLGDESSARVDFNRFDVRMRNAQQQFSSYRQELNKAQVSQTKDPKAATFNQSYSKVKTQIDGGIADLPSKQPDSKILNSAGLFLSGVFRASSSVNADKNPDQVIKPIGESKQASATKQGSDLATDTIGKLKQSKYVSSGKVYILYEDGRGPSFNEFRVDLPLFIVSNKVTYSGIALPRFVPGKPAFGYISVGKNQTAEMTNISNIAGMDFSVSYPDIVTKAVASTIIKTAVQYAANSAIDQKTQDNQLLGSILKIGTGAVQAASTKADTRVWANLPNTIQVAVIDKPATGMLSLNSPTGNKLTDVTLPASSNSLVVIKASGTEGTPAVYVKALPTKDSI